jgi:hypothetical protein
MLVASNALSTIHDDITGCIKIQDKSGPMMGNPVKSIPRHSFEKQL